MEGARTRTSRQDGECSPKCEFAKVSGAHYTPYTTKHRTIRIRDVIAVDLQALDERLPSTHA